MKRTLIIGLVAVGIVLGGCSSTPASEAGTSTSGAFPVTVTASNGKVTIPARPTRIMSLSASATGMLYAIGAGHQVVAVDEYSTSPANAPRTSLSGFETDAESYLSFHPDLVVLAQSQGDVVAQLQSLHVAVLVLGPATTAADSYGQFETLGTATGHAAGAASEVSSIRSRLAAIAAAVSTKAKGQTYYQELDPTFYSAASHTFIGALYGRLGMVNVADTAASSAGTQYPQLSPEYLLKANPDYVFLADSQCCSANASTFAARPGFSALKAVRLHHVFAIPDPIASQWGPSMVEFLQMVANDVTGRTNS